jgi:hypothetical protein
MAEQVQVRIVSGNIQCDPERLVLKKGEKDVSIRWKITPSSEPWVFTDDGVVIKSPDDQFSGKAKEDGGKTFHWSDKNGNNKEYPYTVNLTNGAQTLTLDPTIVNQN